MILVLNSFQPKGAEATPGHKSPRFLAFFVHGQEIAALHDTILFGAAPERPGLQGCR